MAVTRSMTAGTNFSLDNDCAGTPPSDALICDFAPLSQEPSGDDGTPRGWSLQKSKPKHRTLQPITPFPPGGAKGTSLSAMTAQEKPWYTIKIQKPKRWRKPDHDLGFYTASKQKICTARFDKERAVCGVYGPDGRVLHTIGHEYAPHSRYRCTAFSARGGAGEEKELFWRALGPSATVLELVEDGPVLRRHALYVYTSDPTQQMDPVTGRGKPLRPNELGQLWFTDMARGWARELERVIFTLGVVLEMRMGGNI